MFFIQGLFSTLAFLVSVYSILCLINIILSWIPGARYTKFGQFIYAITDPYLNLFRNIRWMQVGAVNFSPILSIGILSLLTATLSNISRTGKLYISGLLQSLMALVWEIIFGIGIVVFLLALIRMIVLIAKRGVTPYNSPWNHVDAILSPFCYKIAKPWQKITKKVFSYKDALIITVVSLALALIVIRIVIIFLIFLCALIPF